jgi:hypothetical protein
VKISTLPSGISGDPREDLYDTGVEMDLSGKSSRHHSALLQPTYEFLTGLTEKTIDLSHNVGYNSSNAEFFVGHPK